MVSKLKQARNKSKLTQQEAADLLRVSVRSYKTYENDPKKIDTIKYRYMLEFFEKLNHVDEEHGILTLDEIRKQSGEVFDNYPVDYAYLFGSYAKGTAKEDSDVDILISTELTGLDYFGLVEELNKSLQKRVDLVALQQLGDNFDLINEVLREGVKIYEKA